MHIFKNKTLRRILSALLIAALIIGMDQALGYLLEPVEAVLYNGDFKRDLSELEKTEGKADAVFTGASRTWCTFDPETLENELGLDCVINAATPAALKTAYYVTKDSIERMHPDRVYIGLRINSLLDGDETMQQRMLAFDRLSLKNKLLMVFDCYTPELSYFFKSYRYSYLLSVDQININIREKKELREIGAHLREYNPDRSELEALITKAYFPYWSSCQTGTIKIPEGISNTLNFSEKDIAPDKLKYLDACVELCKENNVELVLVSGITSVMKLYSCTGYQEANDYYKNYAEKNGIKYYNLNYMKDRETLLPDEFMMDYTHCNGYGARVASKFFAEVIKAEEAGEDTSQYFYANLDEFKKSVERIVAVGAEIQPDEERENILHISITSLQNDDVRPLYRVSLREQDEDKYAVARDWTAESELEIEIGNAAGYTIKIEAAAEDPSYGTAMQEYTYEK